MNPIPVVFEPIYKSRPWGGRRLETLLHKRLPPGEAIGESWELVSLPGDESRVRGGPLDGAGLRDLVTRWGRGLLGSVPAADGGFPLLIKFLDACQDLSVQVHPKPAPVGAAELPGIKHEAWFVVHAEPGARILAGARAGATHEEFKRAAGGAGIVGLLQSWPAAAGDCYYLPSGTPHALGAGVVVAEIQTPSDVTFRLYDWDRLGLDGRPRELHLDAGLANLRLDVPRNQIAIAPRVTAVESSASVRLCACERFTIDRVRPKQGTAREFTGGEPLIWIVLSGAAVLRGDLTDLELARGDVVLIPAQSRHIELELRPGFEFLELRIPGAGS